MLSFHKPTEFGLTAPPAASSFPVVVLSSRLLGVLPLAWPSPSPELRSHAIVKRLQLFEFHDLEWFPHSWRIMLTDVLQFSGRAFNPYAPVVDKLKPVLESLNCHNIVDLCSGGSGPILPLQRLLTEKENYPVCVTITDKYPNLDAFRQIRAESKGTIMAMEAPVDATSPPEDLKGFRTFFTSFHHFDEPAARQILADATKKGAGIGVFECNRRSLLMHFAMLLSPLFILFITPWIRPFRWSRLFWTYVIPVIPLVTAWDGFVSNLRTYSPPELRRLAGSISQDNFVWDVGEMRTMVIYRVTYLLGYSKTIA